MKRTDWAWPAMLAALVCGTTVPSSGQDAKSDASALFQKLDKNSDGKVTADEIGEEQQRFFQRLVRLGDKNADGALTQEEFDRANKPEERPTVSLGGPGGDQGRGELRQRFEMLDRNKDGKVTLEEVPEQFRDRMKSMFDRAGKSELALDDFTRLSGGPRPEPGELFKRLDANSDGKLSKDEIPGEMRDRLTAVFDRLGKNELSRDDFMQFMERMRDAAGRPGQPGQERMANPEEMFGNLDTNGDGKLTLEEAPERARGLVEVTLRRAGRDRDGALTKDEFVKNVPPPRDAGRRPEAERPADAPRNTRETERRPEGDPRDGDRRPESRTGEGRGPVIFRLLDTDRDGKLSKDELAKVSEIFNELDRNRDGQLDPFELIGGPPGPPESRGPMRDDAPRDGAPRRDGGRPEGNRRPEAEAANRDRRSDAARPGQFFDRLDKDRDGKISRDEVPEAMKDRFNMIDTNGDGFISQDELRSQAQQFGERIRNRPTEGNSETPRRN